MAGASKEKFIFWLEPLAVFSVFLAVFLMFHLNIDNFFSYDDPYYHAKHAWLMVETGDLALVKPWIAYHFFSYAPVDPWWGYHLLSAGLMVLAGPIWGAKFFAGILAALGMAVFYAVIRDMGVKRPGAWTFFYLGASAVFASRLLVERPLLLAIAFLPAFIWLIGRRKYLLLFAALTLYTLCYNLAPMIAAMAFFYVLVRFSYEKRVDVRLLLSSAGGLLAGILLHPQSLHYVYIMFVHFWQIFALKIGGIDLGLGTEIQTIDLRTTLAFNAIPIVVYMVTAAVYAGSGFWRHKDKLFLNWLFSMNLVWFIIALVVPRAVEYWLPISWTLAAVFWHDFSQTDDYRQLMDKLKSEFKFRYLKILVMIIALLFAGNNFFQIIILIQERNQDGRDQSFRIVNEWLIRHSPRDAVVFYDVWSDWPMMFYYNDHNRYVTGVDPTFLYEYSPDFYWVWRHISAEGNFCEQMSCSSFFPRRNAALVHSALKQKFQASYIVAENNKRSPFRSILDNDRKGYKLILRAPQLSLYEIR